MKVQEKILIFLLLCLIPLNVQAQRGCCSHHGGVSGSCSSSGKQICNDGTLSPSCTCTPPITYTYGCTDKSADNYNRYANKDDGSCIYYTYGCTDDTAKNYNNEADKDDGSCEYYIYGCTDETADNYDIDAEKDNGSCTYSQPVSNINEYPENSDSSNDDSISGILGIGCIAGGYYLYKRKKKSKQNI